jgi:predicted transcriptional regulator
MIIHRRDCVNLGKVDKERMVLLEWEQVIGKADFQPGPDYHDLEELDWRILKHHRKLGRDYSHVVARMLHAAKDEVFAHHRKLRRLKLIDRIKPLIMRYRKGIVDNKWIKHRNHTYYDLTEKGRNYLQYHDEQED